MYLVAEYPKSGGTWFGQMLSDYLDVPFPRNTTRPSLESSVLHGHELYRGYKAPCTVVLRDGRDLMVSFYYHHLFKNEWNHHPTVEKNRKYLHYSDFDDIKSNLPSFIEYMNTTWANKVNHFTWSEFVHSWLGNVHEDRVVRYEDLLSDPEGSMTRVLHSLGVEQVEQSRLLQIIDKYSFEKVSGRGKGKEVKTSFVRKGVAGDWVNHFSDEAKKSFAHYSGDALILCGYEKDDSWSQ